MYGKSASIEKLRGNTKSDSLIFSSVISILYKYNSKGLIYYPIGDPLNTNLPANFEGALFQSSNFKIYKQPGHFVVDKISDKHRYDSSSGRNGTIAQEYSDCLLHATNNFFMLTQIGEKIGSNGKLYYPDFAYTMRDNLNMYLTFYFLELYAGSKDKDYFNSFDIEIIEDTFCSVKNPDTNKTIIKEILAEAKITPSGAVDPTTGKAVYTESDFIKMLRYVFSYIKDGDLTSTSFSFEKDMPQFLWLFKDVDKGVLGIKSKVVGSSGNLTDDDIKKLIAEYIAEYEKREKQKKLTILENKDKDTTNTIIFNNFDETKHDLTKAESPNLLVLSYLISLPSIYYTIFDLDRVKDIERINGSNGLLLVDGFNFSLDYMNQSSNNSLVGGNNKYDNDKTSSSNNYRFGMILHKNIFDVMFSYRYITMDNTNNLIYDDSINFSYFTVGVNLGMNYNLFSNNIIPSKLNIMFMTDFSLDKIKQKDNDVNSFIYRDINFILSNNNILKINNSLLLTKVELISSFIYTRRYLSNIKLENNHNYTIDNTEHNSYLLNFNINLVKTFKLTNLIANNISLGFKYTLNLTNNDDNNTFKLTNIYYNNIYAIVKPTNQYKHLYSLELSYNITINKRFNINMNIGKEINYRNNTFMGIGLMVGW